MLVSNTVLNFLIAISEFTSVQYKECESKVSLTCSLLLLMMKNSQKCYPSNHRDPTCLVFPRNQKSHSLVFYRKEN